MNTTAKSLTFTILTALCVYFQSSLLGVLKAFTEHPVDYTCTHFALFLSSTVFRIPHTHTDEQLGRLFQRPADFPYQVAVSLDQHSTAEFFFFPHIHTWLFSSWFHVPVKRLPWLYLLIFCTIFIGPDILLTGVVLLREIFFAITYHLLYLFHSRLRCERSSPSLPPFLHLFTY
ncbi:uncharacterized protein BT62DRAFT_168477 [Guyanagaster necrorhizus]|uniref:Uncharacterized protein n=1 Tax=Guyanagaster necrorhizus TaxID=856835 RepID=A0A9P7VS63_9AGAR|nr:uncharacterized protein BT62DRAFT_168477 [Guyanagaster necrorhizus MCA 3950]KAG7445617.1 hypothetical protein BT62DRAFT_168477 [Guyanagaster necrorhizus MCA 3950]